MSKVLIVAEHREGVLKDSTFELVSLARELQAAAGLEPVAIVVGHDVGPLAATLARYVPRTLVVDAEPLAHFRYETHAAVLKAVLEREAPLLALGPHSAFGTELFPRLSVESDRPCATDCVQVEVRDGLPSVVRSVYNGKIHARATFAPAAGYLLTVRGGSRPSAAEAPAAGAVENLPCPDLPSSPRTEFLGYRKADAGGVDMAQAPFIVAVGRGIKDEENVPRVQELADRMGAVLACSRPVVDKKWMEKSRQVGTSGHTVKPRAYLALGISGAFQHMAGIKGGGVLIAVNRDAKAPIFAAADYGVVEDMFKIIDALKAETGA